MQEHFRRITDIDRLIKKFQRKRVTATLKVQYQNPLELHLQLFAENLTGLCDIA